MVKVEWLDGRSLEFDSTVMFSPSYDFDGLERYASEAVGPDGRYLVWPSGKRWSIYRESDGACAFERFGSEAEAMEKAEHWMSEFEAPRPEGMR